MDFYITPPLTLQRLHSPWKDVAVTVALVLLGWRVKRSLRTRWRAYVEWLPPREAPKCKSIPYTVVFLLLTWPFILYTPFQKSLLLSYKAKRKSAVTTDQIYRALIYSQENYKPRHAQFEIKALDRDHLHVRGLVATIKYWDRGAFVDLLHEIKVTSYVHEGQTILDWEDRPVSTMAEACWLLSWTIRRVDSGRRFRHFLERAARLPKSAAEPSIHINVGTNIGSIIGIASKESP